MIIKTSDSNSIKPFVDKLCIPKSDSHKGQNGRVLIIGGSSLFHSSSIWAAEIASCLVDIVHYSSTKENNEIILSLKKKFRNGIVIPKKQLLDYVKEDDLILVGPGMIRSENGISNFKFQISNFDQLLKIKDEGEYTYQLTKYLIENFPKKRFVFDAGALQMLDKEWLLELQTKPILTPHQKEFERVFGINLFQELNKEKIIKQTAKKYNCFILLKTVTDIVSDGDKVYSISGGNAGLTKGGTGDLLSGLATGLAAKTDVFSAMVLASWFLKTASDRLFKTKGYWYNIDNLIEEIQSLLKESIL